MPLLEAPRTVPIIPVVKPALATPLLANSAIEKSSYFLVFLQVSLHLNTNTLGGFKTPKNGVFLVLFCG
jgi:hypothetical protein